MKIFKSSRRIPAKCFRGVKVGLSPTDPGSGNSFSTTFCA